MRQLLKSLYSDWNSLLDVELPPIPRIRRNEFKEMGAIRLLRWQFGAKVL